MTFHLNSIEDRLHFVSPTDVAVAIVVAPPAYYASATSSQEPSTSPPHSPSIEDEAKYPRASVAIDAFSVVASTFAATLALLPVARAKILRQLPRSPAAALSPFPSDLSLGRRILPHLAGAKPALQETAVRFATTSLLPQPLSLLLGYLGSIPLNAAIVRAQAGFHVTPARRKPAVSPHQSLQHIRSCTRQLPRLTSVPGFRTAWLSHLLREIPFTIAEAYTIAFLLSAVERTKRQRKADSKFLVPISKKDTTSADARQGEQTMRPRPFDAAVASAFAGLCSSPFDFLRTRLVVSARPSFRRTVAATARLLRQRGPRQLLVPNGTAAYVAECMIRPIAFLSIYAACRSTLITSWILFQHRREQKSVEKTKQRQSISKQIV